MFTDSRIISIVILVLVLLIASIFSLLETATVAVSEYRLQVLKENELWAKYAYKLKS